MDVAICGLGVVGSALRDYLKNFTEHNVLEYDPPKNKYASLENAKVAFVCVPAATNDTGQDLSIVQDVIDKIPTHCDIIIRSTLLPGTCDYLIQTTKHIIMHMPEFLTERRAYDDMKTLDIVVGIPKGLEIIDENYFKQFFPNKKIIMMTNQEAELCKYAHNCFGALKVTYFNMIYDICQKAKYNYENVLRGTLMTGHCTPTYTQVPGPDGLKGFGGACFLKDTKALKLWLESAEINAKLIASMLEHNVQYRNGQEKTRNWTTSNPKR